MHPLALEVSFQPKREIPETIAGIPTRLPGKSAGSRDLR